MEIGHIGNGAESIAKALLDFLHMAHPASGSQVCSSHISVPEGGSFTFQGQLATGIHTRVFRMFFVHLNCRFEVLKDLFLLFLLLSGAN